MSFILFSGSLCYREASSHSMRILKQLLGEVHDKKLRPPAKGPVSISSWKRIFQSQLDLQLTADPANVLKLQPPRP